jgi:intergrase/recombinase
MKFIKKMLNKYKYRLVVEGGMPGVVSRFGIGHGSGRIFNRKCIKSL